MNRYEIEGHAEGRQSGGPGFLSRQCEILDSADGRLSAFYNY